MYNLHYEKRFLIELMHIEKITFVTIGLVFVLTHVNLLLYKTWISLLVLSILRNEKLCTVLWKANINAGFASSFLNYPNSELLIKESIFKLVLLFSIIVTLFNASFSFIANRKRNTTLYIYGFRWRPLYNTYVLEVPFSLKI